MPKRTLPTELPARFARMLRLNVGRLSRFSEALSGIGSKPAIGSSVSALISVKLSTTVFSVLCASACRRPGLNNIKALKMTTIKKSEDLILRRMDYYLYKYKLTVEQLQVNWNSVHPGRSCLGEFPGSFEQNAYEIYYENMPISRTALSSNDVKLTQCTLFYGLDTLVSQSDTL